MYVPLTPAHPPSPRAWALSQTKSRIMRFFSWEFESCTTWWKNGKSWRILEKRSCSCHSKPSPFIQIIFNLWATHYPFSKPPPFFFLCLYKSKFTVVSWRKKILTDKILCKGWLRETDPQRHVQCLLGRDKMKKTLRLSFILREVN